MPRRSAAILCLISITAGCASVPSYPHNPTEQRYKRGSLYHAYGAPMIVTGVFSLLGGVALIGASAGGEDTAAIAVPGVVSLCIGVLSMAVGGALVSMGNEQFTPEGGKMRPETVIETPRSAMPGRRTNKTTHVPGVIYHPSERRMPLTRTSTVDDGAVYRDE